MFEGNGGDPNVESAIEHIAVAQSIDALLVAPATANLLAKFAQGIADDFLTTLFLASTAPVIVAPAMNVNMWENPAMRANLEILRSRGVSIVEPGSGYLACGLVGAGRLASNEAIVAATLETLGIARDLTGETILITAGPTREPIDPVRYISNRSSGKMGYALAEAALRRGARVILVSGPVALKPPTACEVVAVETTAQMRDAVLARLGEVTVVIKAAAVADFAIRQPSARKLKRHEHLSLDLEPTSDILAEVAARKQTQIVIGFAAETENVLENARRKLATKSLDAIVANDVSQPGIGMDSERNAVTIITPSEVVEVAEADKLEIAQRVLDAVVRLRARRASSETAGVESVAKSGAKPVLKQ
jgi:phosphopantothenoylcysteine decarboxylase/phosphopantothenate--cysteine ligase